MPNFKVVCCFFLVNRQMIVTISKHCQHRAKYRMLIVSLLTKSIDNNQSPRSAAQLYQAFSTTVIFFLLCNRTQQYHFTDNIFHPTHQTRNSKKIAVARSECIFGTTLTSLAASCFWTLLCQI